MQQNANHRTQLEQWYERYGEAVYRRCARIVRDDALAWDMTQEVFLNAYRGLEGFRGDCSPLTWLFTITDRRCISELRKQRTRRHPGGSVDAEAVLTAKTDLEAALAQSDLICALLPRFAEDVQQIVVLRFVDDLDQQEIADQLGIARKTVQRKLQRFIKQAKKIVDRWERDGEPA